MGGTFVGVATNTVVDLLALNSIHKLELGPDDFGPNFYHSARGDVSRQRLTEKFLAGPWEWCVYLDSDMQFPPNLLQKLLAHDKPFVGGLYFRRQTSPMFPLAFEYTDPPRLPFMPLFDYPDDGLVRINATGCGCWLVHRNVYEPVQREMQQTVYDELGLELDNIPYMMDGPMPEVRGDYERTGADLRFSYYARQAGFDIWLDCDPELNIGHYAHVPLARRHYEKQYPRLHKTRAGMYQTAASEYKEVGMDTEALEMTLRRYEQQLEAVKVDAERLEAQKNEAIEALKELQRKADQIGGAIEALRMLQDD